METRNLTCICCPMGCPLMVRFDKDHMEDMVVEGNTCPRGKIYARDEVTKPVRVVTGTICVKNRPGRVVSVKTAGPIDKDKIFAIADRLKELSVEAPVKIGDLVENNICQTGQNLVITTSLD